MKGLSFDKALDEVFECIRLNGRITRNYDYSLSNGVSMHRFLVYNKDKLYNRTDEKALFIVNVQWESNLSFEDKLFQAYVFITSYGNIYRSLDLHFSDGSNVYEWLRNNFDKIDEMTDDKAVKICENLGWKMEENEVFLLKLYEIYLFLTKGALLTAKRDINFTVDNSSLFNWFRYKKREVYELSFTNDLAKAVVCELEKIKPNYFAKVKKEILSDNGLPIDSTYDKLDGVMKQKVLKRH